MKKIFPILTIVFFIMTNAYAEIENFTAHYKPVASTEEFDVTYYLYDEMKVINTKKSSVMPVTQAFSIENGRYEERYTLFADTGTNDETRKMEYLMTALEYASKAAGMDLTSSRFTAFKDSDVKEEFNGDFGHTCFIVDPYSSYASGYKYMLMDFFCKAGQGFVMRTILTNDSTVFTEQSNTFTYVYHSFKFKDKEALFW